MFGRISFGRSSGGSSSSNSGGSGVSAGSGREITIRCGRGSYETRNHYWSEKAQACVDIYASSASKYPSGTGSSSREGRGGGGVKSGSDESKESGREYSSYTSRREYAVGFLLSEAAKYGLNTPEYQIQVNSMSWGLLSKQYKGWKTLEKQILVGKVLSQYSEATGKSLDEIDEQTKREINNTDLTSLEKIYNDNVKNKQEFIGTILSQVNEISYKPLHEIDQETISFVNNAELATLQLIYDTNLNQKQLLSYESFSLYKFYFMLPVNVSYKLMYEAPYLNSDINKLFTRQLDLNNITKLNFSNSQIGDEGARLLADSIQKGEMSKLKTLHLEGNKFSSAGESYLAVAVNKAPNDTLGVIVEKHTSSAGIWNFIKKAFNYYAQEHYKKAQVNDEAALAIYGQDDWAHCKKLVADTSQDMATGFVKYSKYKLAEKTLKTPYKLVAVGGVFMFATKDSVQNVNVENLVYCLTAINQEIENIIKPNGDVSYFSPELIGNNGEVDDGF